MFFKLIENYNKNKKKRFYFLVTSTYSFGNCCEEIKLAALESYRLKKKLVIIPLKIFQKVLKFNIPNKYLLNDIIIKDKKKNIHNKSYKIKIIFYFVFILINSEFFFRRSAALLLKYFFKIIINEINFFPTIGFPIFTKDVKKIKKIHINFQKFDNLEFNISDKAHVKCQLQLEKLGVNIKKKFICLHVRDGEFKKDYNRRPVRNVDIKNYYKMIEYLISKNYNVIRFGRVQKEKIKIKRKEIIDYPFLDIKSDVMDLYLIKNCEFFIGNLSGPLEAAYMFDKPSLALDANMIFEAFPRHRLSRSVFRKLYFKKNLKKISLKEFINLDLKFHHHKFLDDSIKYECLNDEEILNETKNYLNIIEKKNSQLTNTQVKFNTYLLENLILKINKLFKEPLSNNKLEDIDYYKKKLFYIKNSQGSYSDFFLKNNGF